MCISGFKNRFLPEIVLITLRDVGLQIKLSLAFGKALDVYFNFPKFQILIRYGLEIIGLEVDLFSEEQKRNNKICEFCLRASRLILR